MAEKKVIITTDSTSDLSKDLIEKYDIKVLPLYIEIDGQSYKDGVDITPQQLYDYYERTGHVAHTSAVNVAEYEDFFKQFTEQGYDVVHIGLASVLSSTFTNSKVAAEELEGVYIADSFNLSTGIGLIVLKAAEMAQDGLSAKEITEKCKDLAVRSTASFVLDTLDYMHAGGRCSSVAKLGANLLKLKPSIKVQDDGSMSVDKKYRGKITQCYINYIDDTLSDLNSIEPDRIFVTSTLLPEGETERLKKYVEDKKYFKEILVTTAGCVITSHCGPGCMGVLFFKK